MRKLKLRKVKRLVTWTLSGQVLKYNFPKITDHFSYKYRMDTCLIYSGNQQEMNWFKEERRLYTVLGFFRKSEPVGYI